MSRQAKPTQRIRLGSLGVVFINYYIFYFSIKFKINNFQLISLAYKKSKLFNYL